MKEQKYKAARFPGRDGGPLDWKCRYKNVTPILFRHTTTRFIHIEDKLEGIRDLAKDFDTGADREHIINDAVGGNAGEPNDVTALSISR